jgi:cytochrome c peroxidase
MLLAHETPPAMSTGVRAAAEVAVRAGMTYIQFTEQPETDAEAIDAYLSGLRPVPSPGLESGNLTASARRGKALFESEAVGCAECHPSPHGTDLKLHDVGTRGPRDHRARFDTPALTEIWRTAPYLHDGRSATIMEVLTTHNPEDRHGQTSHLSPEELRDLAAYVLSW